MIKPTENAYTQGQKLGEKILSAEETQDNKILLSKTKFQEKVTD